jgi:signal transduction histidine kinase
MDQPSPQVILERIARELRSGDPVLPQIWSRRAHWQVRMRWGVPPVIALIALIGHGVGFDFRLLPVLGVAAAIFAYNIVLALVLHRETEAQRQSVSRDRVLTILGVSCDYAAMLLLIYFTGGAASPLLFFFIFHVIIAAIQFRPVIAYLVAALAVAGVWSLVAMQLAGALPCHCVSFQGQEFCFLDYSAHMVVRLNFFTATVFLTALLSTLIMGRLRERVRSLADASRQIVTLNDRFQSLYAMVRAVGSERRLEPVLKIVTQELAAVLDVRVVAVKLLSEDRQTLRFVAAHGLPEEFMAKNVVQLAQSPLNRQVIEGEALIHGRVTADDTFQLHDDLVALGIESVVFVPLIIEERVIGILGAYCHVPNRFGPEETQFLELAAELTAVAVEEARAYEAIETLMEEHTKFMMQVAHNMRAPIGASLSMLELMAGGYLGDLTENQRDYLQRVDRRLRTLNKTIGQLLTIGRTRDWSREIVDVQVDLVKLARQLERTFAEEAKRKELRFAVRAEAELPAVDSGANLIEQIMENLVSNAIKYTPLGGSVEVRFERGQNGEVRIVVADTGIGIPAAEQAQLFHEFFRASNARRLQEVGTGLGLALVKKAVERHHGRIVLASDEGEGTTITIDLPVRQKPHADGTED